MAATRAAQNIAHGTIVTYTVEAAKGATKGLMATAGATALNVQDAVASDEHVIGIFLEAATAGNPVQVLLFTPLVKALVGTGDCTWGQKQILHATGITDAPAHDSSGATDDLIVGIAMNTGVAGDFVGFQPISGNRGSA